MTISRLEIPKAVKLVVFKRAGGPEAVQCEGCGLMLGGKRFAYDHQIPEWMRTLPRSERRITENDVKLLGEACCHQPKTAKEAGQRAHGDRLITKAARAARKGPPIPGSKASCWKKKVDGTVVHRAQQEKR